MVLATNEVIYVTMMEIHLCWSMKKVTIETFGVGVFHTFLSLAGNFSDEDLKSKKVNSSSSSSSEKIGN